MVVVINLGLSCNLSDLQDWFDSNPTAVVDFMFPVGTTQIMIVYH